MKTADGANWQRTSPLAIAFFVGRVVEQLAKNAFQAAAPIAAYSVAAEGGAVENAILAGSVLIAGTLIVAVLRYLFFRFSIDDTSIYIRDGVFRKTRLDIKFSRIQAVNTEQNILFRAFDLVTIRLDTAGSSQQEGHLPAVPSTLAGELEARLGGRREATVAASPDEDEKHDGLPEPILRYGTADVVRVGLTSNRALILLAVAAPFLEPLFTGFLERTLSEDVSEAARQTMETGIALLVFLVFAFAATVAALLVVLSIAGAVLRYHGFELYAGGERFRSVGGLLTRQVHSIRYAKIQSMVATRNIVQRLFGVYKLSVRQAASGNEGSTGSFVVPLLQREPLLRMTRESFGDEFPQADLSPDGRFVRVSPLYIRSNLLVKGLLPALIATLLALPAAGAGALVALVWIPLCLGIYWRSYRQLGLRLHAEGLALRRGFLGVRVVAHLYRKVQRVTLSQTPFQRRHRLATLRLYLASGTVRVPFVPLPDAERLRDYILYIVETDRRAWL